MIGASKILTVSYGTFSCTLEGFDEPFGTMKAIAEYFRDLAAEDRYFGAEPPTPDAAMLHRIAEREIHRRVEARVQDNGVILRAGAIDERQDSLPAPAASLRPMPAAETVVGAEPVESVAAKLMRIRAAALVATAAPVATPDALADAGPTVSAEALADDDHARPHEAEPSFDATADAVEIVEIADDAIAPIDGPFDSDADAVDDAPEVSAISDAEARDEADDQTADEALITAVLAETGSDDLPDAAAEAAPEAASDWHASPDCDVASADPSSDDGDDGPVANGGRDWNDGGDVEDDAPSASAPMMANDDVRHPADDTVAAWHDEPGPDVAAGMPSLDDLDADDDLPPVAEPRADLLSIEARAEPDEPESQAQPEPTHLPARFSAALEKIQRARARVIKIRRAGAPDAVPAGPAATSGLSPEAAAALARALAEDQTVEEPRAQEEVAPARPARRPSMIEEEEPAVDASVSRLLAQTNSEMDVPEQRRRRSAIEHLKAAVAATVADRRVGGARPPSEEERADPYRTDLSRMVGPRPVPTPERPTPLVLVSEQRIDPAPAQDGLSRGPVRPRRLGGSPLVLHSMVQDDEADGDDEAFDAAEPIDPQGFAAFAERLGAENLSDLLEAAAAYTAVIEGRPHFSRPHLMRQVGAVLEAEDFTRETGLRSFGTLLRTGRVLRVKRGQYALADDSRYMTEAKAQ